MPIVCFFTWRLKDFNPERSLGLVRHALGPGAASLDIDICSVRPWTMNALIADSYESLSRRNGSVSGTGNGDDGNQQGRGTSGTLLIGDAAHQFPPAGGFGLNTGVQVRFQPRNVPVALVRDETGFLHVDSVQITDSPSYCLPLTLRIPSLLPFRVISERKFEQDAHNLAWKLAAVHHGFAPRELLLSYGKGTRMKSSPTIA